MSKITKYDEIGANLRLAASHLDANKNKPEIDALLSLANKFTSSQYGGGPYEQEFQDLINQDYTRENPLQLGGNMIEIPIGNDEPIEDQPGKYDPSRVPDSGKYYDVTIRFVKASNAAEARKIINQMIQPAIDSGEQEELVVADAQGITIKEPK